jgi:adenosylhomocysteinase
MKTSTFEGQRMVTTSAAVEQTAASIRKARKRLPNLVLSSHLEAKFSSWCIALRDAGFGVCVSPSNPASTMHEEANKLREEAILVLPRDPNMPLSNEFWMAIADFKPDIVFDDGALLINSFIHKQQPLSGAVEFTTSGHENLSGPSKIPFPVLDVGLSYCKYELGNVYGTGVSALVAISYSVNVHWAARSVLVVGYGAVGRSVANTARSLGANVLVVDNKINNMARAHFDGHRVGRLKELISEADIVITCSGSNAVLDIDLLSQLPDNAIVANVGCFASEIDLSGLRSASKQTVRYARQIETFHLNGKHIHVLADAELVNLSIGRGWPIELIDLCFGLSTLCFAEVWLGGMEPGLQRVPRELDQAALSLFMKAHGLVRGE